MHVALHRIPVTPHFRARPMLPTFVIALDPGCLASRVVWRSTTWCRTPSESGSNSFRPLPNAEPVQVSQLSSDFSFLDPITAEPDVRHGT
jgi:hypothetical protein